MPVSFASAQAAAACAGMRPSSLSVLPNGELVAVAVSDPQKVRYGGLAEKEGVDEGSRVGRLRRTTEAALVKTWSYELAATTRYKGVGEAMRVEGGGLRRTVEDFQWCPPALAAQTRSRLPPGAPARRTASVAASRRPGGGGGHGVPYVD